MTISLKMRLFCLIICVIFVIVDVRGHVGEDDSKEVSSSTSSDRTSTSRRYSSNRYSSGRHASTTTTAIKTTTTVSTTPEVKSTTSKPVTNTPTPDNEKVNKTSQPVTRSITGLVNVTANSVTEDSNDNETAMFLAIGILAGVALIAIVAAILLRCRSTTSSNEAQVKGQAAVRTANPIYRQEHSGSRVTNDGPYLIPRISPSSVSGHYYEIPASAVSTDRRSKQRSDKRPSGSQRTAEPSYLDLLPD